MHPVDKKNSLSERKRKICLTGAVTASHKLGQLLSFSFFQWQLQLGLAEEMFSEHQREMKPEC